MKQFMKRALTLAQLASGWTAPNPMVGAVITKNNRIIGEGYHRNYGGLHAERQAINHAIEKGNSLKGATLYVTLEPCCHYGKTSPCTEAIIASGIKKVVIACLDSNQVVAGKGARILQNSGIEVEIGLMKEESQYLNRSFHYFMEKKLPYITMKHAMSIDGRIATQTGQSRWITGKGAREHVHHQRHLNQAIMVGSGTVLADDPLLTVRIKDFNGNNPLRIICDSRLKTPIHSKLVQTANSIPTIIATINKNENKQKRYTSYGVRIVTTTPTKAGQVNLRELLQKLADEKIQSVYVEGGANIHGALLKKQLIQEVHTYVAPKLIGGKDRYHPIENFGFDKLSQVTRLQTRRVEYLGSDLFIESRVV